MNIHEYQAKELLAQFGVPVPQGTMAETAEQAEKIANDLGGKCVVKAQIHAGGRGKGGGVKLAQSAQEAKQLAQEMLGMTLITHQTGAEGRKVRLVYVEAQSEIAKEFYCSLVLDRTKGWVSLVVSPEGGMDIEEVADKTPDKILSLAIDPVVGVRGFQLQACANFLGLDKAQSKGLASLIRNLYRAYWEKDMSLLEINPLILTKQSELLCLDAKIGFDNNALFRHAKDIVPLRDENEEEPAEREATKYDLSYVKLDGTIGCMVNGAGLAMATMDMIKLYGAEPANFLDVGGGADKEKVANAFKLILSDSAVRGILVNIFGGIMRCDIIAEGVLAAAKELKLSVPLVVRLAGTNVEQGKKILAESDLDIIPADDLDEAAQKIVSAVGK